MSENDLTTATPTVNQPLIAVSGDKYDDADTQYVWTGKHAEFVDKDGNPKPQRGYRVLPLDEVLTRSYSSDAHFTTSVVVDQTTQPRLSKSDRSLAQLRERGYEVLHYCLVFDIDVPGHGRMTDELDADAQERIGSLDPGWGSYGGRGGFRLLRALSRPISSEHYEHEIRQWIPRLQAHFGPGWTPCAPTGRGTSAARQSSGAALRSTRSGSTSRG
jgi:hypothetical protein